jgi:hypothetical protein
MTPQEQELVEELFDRLAKLENSPATRLPSVIADSLRRAPQATYALVQTALVQDEALKRANVRIEELQAQLGGGEQAQQPGSFLDSMRDAVLGRRDPRSSVPTVRSQAQSSSTTAPPYQRQGEYPPPMNPNAMGGPAFGSGRSFLGTAASTAAGVIARRLLLNSIRPMFGQHAGLGGQKPSAFGSSSGSDYGNMAEKQRDQDQDQDQEQDQDQDQDDQDQDDQDQDDQDQDEDQDQDD